MKLKYYLRGLGIGIIITTLILMIAYSGKEAKLTDAEIIARAEALGMVMKEEPLFSNTESNKDKEVVASEVTTEQDTTTEQVLTTENEGGSELETEIVLESESETEDAIVETETTVQTSETYHLIIPSGSVPRLICNELEEQGVIESASSLRAYLVEVGYATSIKVGEYEIPYGATNDEVYKILKAGPL